MSRTYEFYPAIEKRGIYPLIYKGGRPQSVLWRSGGFIDGDWFKELPRIELPYAWGFEEDEFLYRISKKEIDFKGKSNGLVVGYAPLGEIEEYYKTEEKQEYFHWELKHNIVSAEVYAEFSQNKREEYGHIAVVDTYSSEYVCSVLSEILKNFQEYGEVCMVMHYSF